MVFLHVVRQGGREVEGRAGLADAGDVVELALDAKDGGAGNGVRAHRVPAMDHLALRQGVVLEHRLDGLQVELGRQVHYREVLVVEGAALAGLSSEEPTSELQSLMRISSAVFCLQNIK